MNEGHAARTIQTKRLRLRRAVTGDLDALHAMMSDAETMRFWSTPPHADRETTARWLDSMISAPAATSDDFIVELDGRDHLTADVDPRNRGCLALLERNGFHETGRAARTWLVGEDWCDSVCLRSDRPN